jgi:hypothetical protein
MNALTFRFLPSAALALATVISVPPGPATATEPGLAPKRLMCAWKIAAKASAAETADVLATIRRLL